MTREPKEVCRDCEILQGEDCVTLCSFHSATSELLHAASNGVKELKRILKGSREEIEGNLGLTHAAMKELRTIVSKMEKMV